MKDFHHQLLTDVFYFMIAGTGLGFLLSSTSDLYTKLFGILSFAGSIWAAIYWLIRTHKQDNVKH